MGDSTVIAPIRSKRIVNMDGTSDLQLVIFFEKIANYIAADHELLSNISSITTADATDLATVITLANANKAKINEILAALLTTGIMEGP